MRKKIVFIMNPISGSGSKKGIPEAIDKYLDTELFDYEIRTTEYAGHACHIATEAKEQGVDVVVAVGGDGTVNEVARAIVESNTALGIIPCGSGNGLARHLMLPMNVKKCLQKIKTFRCKELKIHRKNEGVIHFDGDPVEAGKDIVVSLKEKGIKVIVNLDADKSLREPNAFQSIAASLFNDLNDMRRVLNKRSQKLGKVIQRKLTR